MQRVTMPSLFCVIMYLVLVATNASAQETVFALLKDEVKLADQYFENKDYQSALALYLNASKKRPSRDVQLKIARSHHFLKQYSRAVAAYESHAAGNSLPDRDLFYYAEAQMGVSNYAKAIESYQNYLERVPDDELILKRIWRLNNVQYLFEDSLHFAVRRVSLNTNYGELCAVPYQGGIVFISNRQEFEPVTKLDPSMHMPFYKAYYSSVVSDSMNLDIFQYSSPSMFLKGATSKYHQGPMAFFDNGNKLVLTSTGKKNNKNNKRTLQLYFAENILGNWKITSAFPFNSDHFSISEPAISQDGKVLYFSSDMSGGYGGKDLYKSELVDGQWTRPVNLGEEINTFYDEVFPFVHQHTLYFASNGHPGLGGLDIFKAFLGTPGFGEVENVGYPLNTNFDDFAITIDSLGSGGYFSSNRKDGGYNDDIYQFDMDLQTYPLEINGVVKFKEHSWSDSTDLKVMTNAKIFLIDYARNVTVQEGACDEQGNFSINIPYYSKYIMKVVGQDLHEHIVSLEIPRHRKSDYEHQIVIVKDAFDSN